MTDTEAHPAQKLLDQMRAGTMPAAASEKAISTRVHGMNGWQPIETAPRDGTTIFGQNRRTAERGMVHLNRDGRWELVNGLSNWPDGRFFQPTHWMPLPDPPPVG